jgi:hypothetical protein
LFDSMNSGGIWADPEPFSESFVRDASYSTPASGESEARAIVNCARACSMRNAAARRSRLAASASSTSLSSTGSWKSVHQRSGACACDCATAKSFGRSTSGRW